MRTGRYEFLSHRSLEVMQYVIINVYMLLIQYYVTDLNLLCFLASIEKSVFGFFSFYILMSRAAYEPKKMRSETGAVVISLLYSTLLLLFYFYFLYMYLVGDTSTCGYYGLSITNCIPIPLCRYTALVLTGRSRNSYKLLIFQSVFICVNVCSTRNDTRVAGTSHIVPV